MEERETARPKGWEFGGVELRSSFESARLALIVALTLLVIAGAGLGGVFALIDATLDPVRSGEKEVGGIADSFILFSYGYLAFITWPSMIASMLGVLAVVLQNLRGALSGTDWAALLGIVLAVIIIVSTPLGIFATVAANIPAAILLALPLIGSAIMALYLLRARARRLGRLRGASADSVPERQRSWRIGVVIAIALVFSGGFAALIGAGTYEPIELISEEGFDPERGVGNIAGSHNENVAPIFIFSNLLWQMAVWLLVPLALMASDSYLKLRRRLKQDREDAAGAAT